MAHCIKTGCDVLIEEYNAVVRADLHMMDETVIVKFNVNSFEYGREQADCRVIIGDGYFEKHNGLIVVPMFQCFDIEKYLRG